MWMEKECLLPTEMPNLDLRFLQVDKDSIIIVIVQSLSWVRLFVTPWTAAHQASLSFTISQSSLRLISIELMMPSNHLILCCSLLLLPSIFSSIRILSNESDLHIRWPKYWSFSFSIIFIYIQWIFKTDFLKDQLVGSPCSPRDSQESSPIPQFKSISSSNHTLD